MKYERELNKVFEEALREPWMDNDDWEFIKIAIVNHPKFDLEKMEKDIDTGIENGYSLDYQLNLCIDILKRMKDNDPTL